MSRSKHSTRQRIVASQTSLSSLADVHACYEEAVQDVVQEVKNLCNFFLQMRDLRDTSGEPFEPQQPEILREDFCGTAILCREWVKKNVMRYAIGVDLDEEVIDYASKHTFDGCIPGNIQLIVDNVVNLESRRIDPSDIVVALNYSTGYFHSFSSLVQYFRVAKLGIRNGGIFVCDMFGFSRDLGKPNRTFTRKCSNFTYFFEQSDLDPMTNTCNCHISFKFIDGSQILRAFSYHFRIWSICELLDALREAGYKKSQVWYYDSSDQSNCKTGLKKELILLSPKAQMPLSYNFYVVAAQ
jgi:hypothetical protein